MLRTSRVEVCRGIPVEVARGEVGKGIAERGARSGRGRIVDGFVAANVLRHELRPVPQGAGQSVTAAMRLLGGRWTRELTVRVRGGVVHRLLGDLAVPVLMDRDEQEVERCTPEVGADPPEHAHGAGAIR
jgi:hypothetical protein